MPGGGTRGSRRLSACVSCVVHRDIHRIPSQSRPPSETRGSMQRPHAKLAAILLLLCSSLCAAATAAAASRSSDALLASGGSIARAKASVASSLRLRALQQAQPESDADHDHDHDHDTATGNSTAVPSGTVASPVAAAPLAGQAATPTPEADHAHEEGEHSHGEEDHGHIDHSTPGPTPSGVAQPAEDHDHDHAHEHEQHAGEEGHDHSYEAVKDGSRSPAAAPEDHDHEHGHEGEHDHEGEAKAPSASQGTSSGVEHDHAHEDDHDHAGEQGPTAGSNHDHDHDEEHSKSNNGDDSLSLRIAAVFIVLVGGVLGCALPAVLQGWLVRRPLVSACLRALSAGVLLALALLHVTTHAVEELDGLAEGPSAHDDQSVSSPSSDPHVHRLLSELLLSGSLTTSSSLSLPSNDDLVKLLDQQLHASDSAAAPISWRRALLQADDGHGHGSGQAHDHPFPMGMLAVLVGFLLMAALEHVVHALSHPPPLSNAHSADSCDVLEPNAKSQTKGGELGVVSVGITCEHKLSHAIANPNSNDPAAAAAACTDASCDKSLKLVIVQPAEQTHGSHGPGGRPDIVACCTEHPLASSLERFRLAVLAPVMELGCIFHSFIIGLSLGVLYAYGDVRTLLIALVFHQFLEGIGLLTVMVGAGMRRLQLFTAGLIFSLTCPVGIAVGIGISKSYNPESITARAVQGTLNGVSAGLLLYLSSALIQCEFGSQGMGRWKAWERLVIFGVIVLGAGVFAMLAIWA